MSYVPVERAFVAFKLSTTLAAAVVGGVVVMRGAWLEVVVVDDDDSKVAGVASILIVFESPPLHPKPFPSEVVAVSCSESKLFADIVVCEFILYN